MTDEITIIDPEGGTRTFKGRLVEPVRDGYITIIPEAHDDYVHVPHERVFTARETREPAEYGYGEGGYGEGEYGQ